MTDPRPKNPVQENLCRATPNKESALTTGYRQKHPSDSVQFKPPPGIEDKTTLCLAGLGDSDPWKNELVLASHRINILAGNE